MRLRASESYYLFSALLSNKHYKIEDRKRLRVKESTLCGALIPSLRFCFLFFCASPRQNIQDEKPKEIHLSLWSANMRKSIKHGLHIQDGWACNDDKKRHHLSFWILLWLSPDLSRRLCRAVHHRLSQSDRMCISTYKSFLSVCRRRIIRRV